MGDTNTTVKVAIEAITSNAEAGFKRVSTGAEAAASVIKRSWDDAGSKLSPTVASFAEKWTAMVPTLDVVASSLTLIGKLGVGAMVVGTKAAGEWAHSIQDGAAALGETSERYEALARVAGKRGIDPMQFTNAAVGIARMLKAAKDTDSALGREKASAMRRIGLDPNEMLQEGDSIIDTTGRVMKALSNLQGAERASAAAELGLSARMLKLLKVRDLGKEMAEAMKSPTFLKDDELEKLDAAFSSMRKLGATIGGTWRLVWVEAAPGLTKMYDLLNGLATATANFVRHHPGMVGFLTNVVSWGTAGALMLGRLVAVVRSLGNGLVWMLTKGSQTLNFLSQLPATAQAAMAAMRGASRSALIGAETQAALGALGTGAAANAAAGGAAATGGLAAAAAGILASPAFMVVASAAAVTLAAYVWSHWKPGKPGDTDTAPDPGVNPGSDDRAPVTITKPLSKKWNIPHIPLSPWGAVAHLWDKAALDQWHGQSSPEFRRMMERAGNEPKYTTPRDVLSPARVGEDLATIGNMADASRLGNDSAHRQAVERAKLADQLAKGKISQSTFDQKMREVGAYGESITSAPAGANATRTEVRVDATDTNRYLARLVELTERMLNRQADSANAARFAPMAARSYAYPY